VFDLYEETPMSRKHGHRSNSRKADRDTSPPSTPSCIRDFADATETEEPADPEVFDMATPRKKQQGQSSSEGSSGDPVTALANAAAALATAATMLSARGDGGSAASQAAAAIAPAAAMLSASYGGQESFPQMQVLTTSESSTPAVTAHCTEGCDETHQTHEASLEYSVQLPQVMQSASVPPPPRVVQLDMSPPPPPLAESPTAAAFEATLSAPPSPLANPPNSAAFEACLSTPPSQEVEPPVSIALEAAGALEVCISTPTSQGVEPSVSVALEAAGALEACLSTPTSQGVEPPVSDALEADGADHVDEPKPDTAKTAVARPKLKVPSIPLGPPLGALAVKFSPRVSEESIVATTCGV
jgi:hypothetical protein